VLCSAQYHLVTGTHDLDHNVLVGAENTDDTWPQRSVYVGVLYPRYLGAPVMTHKSGYDQFPPVTNGWGTTHPVPDTTPPLLTEGEGHLPKKN
jgi:hypothetical protein